jgi:DNA-binding HxlR family transcriptional regulator
MTEPTNKIYYCPIELALDLIGGKWKPMLLVQLRDGCLGFGELSRRIPLATRRLLAKQLRELEHDGLVERKEVGEFPPPIEYRLTVVGRRLIPVLDQLRDLGELFARRSEIVFQEPFELAFGEDDRATAGPPPLSKVS